MGSTTPQNSQVRTMQTSTVMLVSQIFHANRFINAYGSVLRACESEKVKEFINNSE